jgi:hypothetical protein
MNEFFGEGLKDISSMRVFYATLGRISSWWSFHQ